MKNPEVGEWMSYKKKRGYLITLSFFFLCRHASDAESVQETEIKTLTEDDIIQHFSSTEENDLKKYVIVNVEYLRGIIAYVSFYFLSDVRLIVLRVINF